MRRAMRSFGSATERGGALLLSVFCMAVILGGLSVVMYRQSRGALVDVDRSEAQLRALELAETGIARAELEVASQEDADGDGVGNLQRTFAGGTFSVTATNSGDDWTLISTGRTGKCVRRLEQGCRRVLGSPFTYAVFAKSDVTLSGGSETDSYDSALGTYVSQATHTDAWGTYAIGGGGSVGTNGGDIVVSGGRIRGDATPGPLNSVTVSGGGNVSGSSTPGSQPMDFPAPPQADFTAAYTTNANETWAAAGSVTYDATKKKLTASGGAVVTLAPGTYFFSEFVLSGGSVVKVTGPTTIYVTNKFDTSGGATLNLTGDPANLIVYGHPYPVPNVTPVTTTTMTMSGGSSTYMVVYGPEIALTFSGSSPVFGSFMARTVTASGGSFIHYDANLLRSSDRGQVQEIYWVERNPPLR